MAEINKCVALEWGMTDEGRKDYVPCDGTDAEPCRLVGLLLAVDANLCNAHQKYFASSPKGWGSVKVFDGKTRQRIRFRPYGCEKILMAETLEEERAREIIL